MRRKGSAGITKTASPAPIVAKVLILGLILGACKGGSSPERPDVRLKVVGITQIASHPSLDAVRDGIIAGLHEKGWDQGKNITILFKNANRDPGLAMPIAASFVASRVDVIVPITTPSAIAARQATKSIPIVFAGVTDPIGVGLIPSLENPGINITGTSDRWPFEKQLSLFRELLKPKVIGMLYSPGDEVSAVAIREMGNLAPSLGIQIKLKAVSTGGDIYFAARSLLTEVDAIYTGLDTLVVENLASVLKAAKEARKPVLSGDEASVRSGAFATYSIDMRELGRETAVLVANVLDGKAAGSLPVVVVSKGKPIVNKTVASELGIEVPDRIAEIASMVESGS